MSNIVVETKRLVLNEFSAKDVDAFYELNNNPTVLKYTGDRAFYSKTETANFICNYDHYSKYGFGRWSLYLKDTNQFIGFNGLRYSETTKEIDIGFRICQNFWGNGYATESAEAVLELAFNRFRAKKIIARAMKENFASHAIIRKLGMEYESDFIEYGSSWVKYQLTKDNWLSK